MERVPAGGKGLTSAGGVRAPRPGSDPPPDPLEEPPAPCHVIPFPVHLPAGRAAEELGVQRQGPLGDRPPGPLPVDRLEGLVAEGAPAEGALEGIEPEGTTHLEELLARVEPLDEADPGRPRLRPEGGGESPRIEELAVPGEEDPSLRRRRAEEPGVVGRVAVERVEPRDAEPPGEPPEVLVHQEAGTLLHLRSLTPGRGPGSNRASPRSRSGARGRPRRAPPDRALRAGAGGPRPHPRSGS